LMDQEADQERAARTLMKLGQTHHTAFDFRSAQQAYDEAFSVWQQSVQAQPESPPPAPHALRVTARVPHMLDPGMANDSASLHTIQVLFGGLVGLTPDGDVVPDVALSWEVSEGGRKYVFQLRTDVQWTDGTRVTAHDFEYAWKRVLAPATASKNASLLFDLRGARASHQGLVPDGQTVGVRALDDHTLEVQLEGPTGYFLHLLAYPGLYPVPRHVVEAHGAAWTDVEHIVTNGPFSLRSFERGTSAVLARNRQYHGQFTGNVEEVELTIIPSGPCPSAVAAYEADLLDTCLLEAAPLDEMERVRQAHAAEYVSLPQSGTFFLSFDGTRAPFDDLRVRQAFAHALDRALLLPPKPAGCYFPATGGFLPPGMPGHTAGIALEHNPLRAQELLAEAGYPEGRGFPEVDLLVWPRVEPVAVGAQAQWRDTLGVQVRVEGMEWPEFLKRISEERPRICPMGWAADYPDPDSCLRVGMGLHRLVEKSDYDELVERARRLTDQAERLRLYRQADRILMEEAAIVPITYERDPLLVKPWVRRFLDWRHTIIDAH